MGVIHSLSAVDYHKEEAISASLLKQLARSPAHARYWLDNPSSGQTAAMRLGTMVHCAILEPERFALEYRAAPAGALKTANDYKAACANAGLSRNGTKEAMKQRLEAANVPVTFHAQEDCSQAEIDKVQAIADSVRAVPGMDAMIDIGHAEVSMLWDDPMYHGIISHKSRPDLWLRHEGIIIDIKTCLDASPQAASRAIKKYRYDLQAAHYLEGLIELGLPAKSFKWLFVETEPPYGVGLYIADDTCLMDARRERDHLIGIYSTCLEFDDWPGYGQRFERIKW